VSPLSSVNIPTNFPNFWLLGCNVSALITARLPHFAFGVYRKTCKLQTKESIAIGKIISLVLRHDNRMRCKYLYKKILINNFNKFAKVILGPKKIHPSLSVTITKLNLIKNLLMETNCFD